MALNIFLHDGSIPADAIQGALHEVLVNIQQTGRMFSITDHLRRPVAYLVPWPAYQTAIRGLARPPVVQRLNEADLKRRGSAILRSMNPNTVYAVWTPTPGKAGPAAALVRAATWAR